MKPVHDEIWELGDSISNILMKYLGSDVQSKVFFGPIDDVYEKCIRHVHDLNPYQKAITR